MWTRPTRVGGDNISLLGVQFDGPVNTFLAALHISSRCEQTHGAMSLQHLHPQQEPEKCNIKITSFFSLKSSFFEP